MIERVVATVHRVVAAVRKHEQRIAPWVAVAVVAVIAASIWESKDKLSDNVGAVRLVVPYAMAAWRSGYLWLAPIVSLILALRFVRALQRRPTGTIRSLLVFGLEAAAVVGLGPATLEALRQDELFQSVMPAVPIGARAGMLLVPGLAVTTIGLALGTLLVLGIRRRVFVSFHHSLEPVAVELTTALTKAGLVVRRIPFDPAHQHDQLLAKVQAELRRCDALVCLPGPVASFVESEVLTASTMRKLIVFIVGDEDPRLPNTALYGYPTFRLDRTRRRRFEPVGQLLLLGLGSLRATASHVGATRVLRVFDSPRLALAVVAAAGAPHVATFGIGLSLGGWDEAVRSVVGLHAFAKETFQAWYATVGLLLGPALVLLGQLRARAVLRQQVLTGRATRATLLDRLGGSRMGLRILACLWHEPPAAENEAVASSPPRRPQ